MSTDTIVQVGLAVSLAVLSVVGAVVGFFFQLAVRKLIEQLNKFGQFVTEMSEHKAEANVRLDGHDQRLDHHQRWLEEQQQRLGTVCKAGQMGGQIGGHRGLATE